MLLKEIHAKTIMSKSKVLDYAINPYSGCEHGCLYCYARFMKRFTGHREEWGKFVDVKEQQSNESNINVSDNYMKGTPAVVITQSLIDIAVPQDPQ